MRIHLPLHPHHFAQPSASSSSGPPPPLVQLGGDLVIVELQGTLTFEGDKSNGVLGVIGLDRPDKPTLHLGEHHLLHGKFVNLQKPYAVIRRVVGTPSSVSVIENGKAVALEGDASEEESDDEGSDSEEEDEEEDQPLFAANPDMFPSTPSPTNKKRAPQSSSPMSWAPASTPKDYSSELDPSSPARSEMDDFGFPKRSQPVDEDDEENEDEEERRRKKRKLGKEKEKAEKEKAARAKAKRVKNKDDKERTRHYEVVGVVRKKVVFALRPEPLVAPTLLPE
ncbi:hypothetical protein CI109_103694 [Kwoniella shandongensis]|uniref:Uncharacterized protein n=1 Tax=Kwoniella shandongensis TaxID=1734106 RepID=A0A5M6C7D0_9TREE|nr:uncharacterized protein CI109_000609 [Kwoniella shandongensis]KAA5531037.1 hypothetical protein CI109_000609 [Kwoniella shandongensis]